MLTRLRFRAPNYTGDAKEDFQNLLRAINNYLLSLEQKNALQIDSAQIRAASGILFPTSQGAASTDPNTLDDYAKGTWTPTFTLAVPGNLTVAYSSQIGTYTKVGRKVVAHFNLVCTPTFTTGSGALRIAGLPFTAASTGTNLYGGPLSVFSGITKAGYSQYGAAVLDATATISILASGSGVAADDVNATSIVSASALILRGAVFLNV